MHPSYGRDLDLNLLRVFVVVAETGSVTEAARRLYVTQPAVSQAIRRLSRAVGSPVFVRSGRGLSLSARGERLLAATRPHLSALVDAALSPADFDPKTSERIVRIGLADGSEKWLLSPLVRTLGEEAPHLRLVILPVQFRTVGEALARETVDFAVTVADDLPADVVREPLYGGGFVCLYDGKILRLPKKLSKEKYLAHEHVIVSYNGDLRGIVEDMVGVRRRVRVSVPTFHGVGTAIDGTRLLGTVPETFARHARRLRPHFRTAELPFSLESTPMELLYRRATADDPALAFVRQHVTRIARAENETAS